MSKTFLFIVVVCLSCRSVSAQTDSVFLVQMNQQIDDLVIKKDTVTLYKLYADDFVFSHGSGRVEGRSGWLKSVGRGNFLLRQHDSVRVEMHPGIAVLKGKMSIQKQNKDKVDKYWLCYIRVYAKRNDQWQLISHNTVFEQHE